MTKEWPSHFAGQLLLSLKQSEMLFGQRLNFQVEHLAILLIFDTIHESPVGLWGPQFAYIEFWDLVIWVIAGQRVENSIKMACVESIEELICRSLNKFVVAASQL